MTIGPIPRLNFQSQWPRLRFQEFGDEKGPGGAGGGPGCRDQEHDGPSYKPMETKCRREKLPGLFHPLVRSRWKSLSSRNNFNKACSPSSWLLSIPLPW